MSSTFLVTGVAGFIGFHVAERLLRSGLNVVGVDNLNSYYDTNLKFARLAELEKLVGFSFEEVDITDKQGLERVFDVHRPDVVIHLAAQAGVRYSLEQPSQYIDSNVHGTLNVLELSKKSAVSHVVYASSSSVYGANTNVPFTTDDRTDHPVSLYAATKKMTELMAFTYAHLYGLKSVGLRFFTVYGPWGRPDMAYFKFTASISAGKPIQVYNSGEMSRDFTYIDDVANAVVKIASVGPVRQSPTPHTVYNVGNHNPEPLGRLIALIEQGLGKKALIENLPMQLGDVKATYADVADIMADYDFRPSTPLEVGIPAFVNWWRSWTKGS